jgi:hypothetical protein
MLRPVDWAIAHRWRVHQTVTELWQRARTEFIRLALYWGSAFWCFFMRAFWLFFSSCSACRRVSRRPL